jgi:hypothetical protein
VFPGDLLAILVSDVHLQDKAPIFRSVEPDWFAAMQRPLDEIRKLSENHQVPVIYAGDIFTYWKCSPHLISFAIDHLPRGYAIAGNHDCPNHRLEDLHRSGYWTLVKAGVLTNLEYQNPVTLNGGDFVIHPFPFGCDVIPLVRDEKTFELNLAVIHAFIWDDSTGFPGAPEDSHLREWKKRLKGYDCTIFGDNHTGFIAGDTILNAGTVMRRKSDEINYKPCVGLLHKNGTISRHYLNTKEDKYLEKEEILTEHKEEIDLSDFTEGLQELETEELDFVEMINQAMKRKTLLEGTEEIIHAAMEMRNE